MNIIHRRGWEIPDRFITPEHLAFSRRSLLAGAASTLALAPGAASAQRVTDVAKLPIRAPIFIPQSATRNTHSTGRSPTKRSMATTIIFTSSAPRKQLPPPPRYWRSGPGR